MKKLGQKGFGVIEILLVLILLAVLGFIGYYVWHIKHNTDKSHNVNSVTTSSQTNKSTPSTSALLIPAWNVEVPLNSVTVPLSVGAYSQDSVNEDYRVNVTNGIPGCYSLPGDPSTVNIGSVARYPANGTITSSDVGIGVDSSAVGKTWGEYISSSKGGIVVGNDVYEFIRNNGTGCSGPSQENQAAGKVWLNIINEFESDFPSLKQVD